MWNFQLPDTEWCEPDEPEKLQEIVNAVSDADTVALDTETTGLVRWKDTPLFWSLSWRTSQGGYRRLAMPSSTLGAFTQVFADPYKTWVFANAKFDMHILANFNFYLEGRIADTNVMHALLYEEQPHDLKYMAQHILGFTWKDFKDTFKMTKGDSAQDLLMKVYYENPSLLAEYAANDAYGTLRLYEELEQQLADARTHSLYHDEDGSRWGGYAINTLWDLFFKVETKFTRVLWKCERNGIKVNKEYLESIRQPAADEIQDLEKQITKKIGRRLNFNSPVQLRKYFIDELGLKPVAFSKGGKTGVRNPSINEAFLDHYKHEVEAAALLLKHRELSKLHNTYIVGLYDHLDPHDRVHCKYNQDVARTGRLSSSDPNMQNIPRPDNDKFALRGAFIAEKGYKLVVADYEQLEMRLLGCASLEPKLLEIFASGKDIHTGNCELVYGIPYEDIVKAKKIDKEVKHKKLPPEALTDHLKMCLKKRNDIKIIGFGLNYGMKEKKLARNLGCSEQEAAEVIERYMDTYPAVRQFYEEAVEVVRETGFAFTVLGRRRYLPEILSYSNMSRWQAERQATNVPIQGSAADAAKLAMIAADDENFEYHYGAKMLLQVHDEIAWECPEETVEEMSVAAKEVMEHPFPEDLAVHLAVDLGVGDSWMEAK